MVSLYYYHNFQMMDKMGLNVYPLLSIVYRCAGHKSYHLRQGAARNGFHGVNQIHGEIIASFWVNIDLYIPLCNNM